MSMRTLLILALACQQTVVLCCGGQLAGQGFLLERQVLGIDAGTPGMHRPT